MVRSIAELLQACVAHLEGRTRDAADRLSSAMVLFERVDMNLYAAVAAQRLDQIARDERTKERRARVDEWMAAQGIVKPGAIARLIAPGSRTTDMWSWKRAGVTALLLIASVQPAGMQTPAKNVVIITIDGFRWQEMFTAADADYFKKEEGDKPGAAERRFWRPSASERRATLMPFMWSTIATKGQVFGDPAAGSRLM
jgi:hypothetical protein